MNDRPWAHVTYALSRGGHDTCLAQYSLYTAGDLQLDQVHKMLLPQTSSFLEAALGPAFQKWSASLLCQ